MRAVQKRQLGVAVLLLDRGADQSIRYFGKVPLHDAATRGPAAMVEALLDAGGDIEVRDDHQATPLIRAAKAGRVDVALALLDRGAAVRVTAGSGLSSLDHAIYSLKPELVRLLLSRGAGPRERRSGGWDSTLRLAQQIVEYYTRFPPANPRDRG